LLSLVQADLQQAEASRSNSDTGLISDTRASGVCKHWLPRARHQAICCLQLGDTYKLCRHFLAAQLVQDLKTWWAWSVC
jgi:hypothetical protein